jgi:hypothetical protein
MNINYARINSAAGPFIFIRLPSEIDQAKHEVSAWAKQLSFNHFANVPVVVHNHDAQGNEILTVWPSSFHSAVGEMTGAGAGLSSMEVTELPCKRVPPPPGHP